MSQIGASNHVKVSGAAMAKAVLRRIVRVFLWTLVALFVIYILFAATLWRVVPSTSGTGPVITTTITAEGGHILPDTDVLISTDQESDSSIMSNLSEAFVPSSERAIGSVVAGPYGNFEAVPSDNNSDNESDDEAKYDLRFEGEDLGLQISGYQISEREDYERDTFLNEEYIIECVSGDCEVGEAVIVPADYVMGEVLPTDEVMDAVLGDRESGFVTTETNDDGADSDGDTGSDESTSDDELGVDSDSDETALAEESDR